MDSVQPMVSLGVRVPLDYWCRLVTLAQRRGYALGDRPNVSEAAREVLALGLQVANGAAEAEGMEAINGE